MYHDKELPIFGESAKPVWDKNSNFNTLLRITDYNNFQKTIGENKVYCF